jgi:hypothetical protein
MRSMFTMPRDWESSARLAELERRLRNFSAGLGTHPASPGLDLAPIGEHFSQGELRYPRFTRGPELMYELI